MSTNKKAETAQELLEKYGSRRITAGHAAKEQLYDFIYWAYLRHENKDVDHTRDTVIKDKKRVAEALQRDFEIGGGTAGAQHDCYYRLCDWLSMTYETAVIVKYALLDVIQRFHEIAGTVIAGEQVKAALTDQSAPASAALALQTLTVDYYRPTGEAYHTLTGGPLSIQTRIDTHMRYVNVYNTFLGLIAKEVDFPELTILQLDMSNVDDAIDALNEALEEARKIIQGREETPVGSAATEAYTAKEKAALLEAFAEVAHTAPPIPETRIRRTALDIKLELMSAPSRGWRSIFLLLAEDYWRRV